MTPHTRSSFLALVIGILALPLGTMSARAADPVTKADLDAALKILNDKLDALKTLPASVQALQKAVTTLSDGLKTLPTDVQTLQKSVASLTDGLKQQQAELVTAKTELAAREAALQSRQQAFQDALIKIINDLNTKMDQRIDNLLIKLAQKQSCDHAHGGVTCTPKCAIPDHGCHSCKPQTVTSCAPGSGSPGGCWGPAYPASCQVVYPSKCRLGCRSGL